MREIKFRAWEKWNNKMRYDICKIHFGFGQEFNGNAIMVDFDEKNHACGIGTGQIKLMQYTGLKDKNGKIIYEGDIVEIKHNKDRPNGNYMKLTVNISDISNLCFKLIETDSKIYELGSFDLVDWCYKDLEIIGNIFENPNLLK